MQLALFKDHVGFDPGRLFNQSIKRPSKKQLHTCGWWRRQSEYSSTPEWALDMDKAARKNIYAECRALNKRDGRCTWVVDHIVPLNHPIVRGWHVSWNMRIILYGENASKSNRYWPDMPETQTELEFHYG